MAQPLGTLRLAVLGLCLTIGPAMAQSPSPLATAAERGDIAAVRRLIAEHAPMDERDGNGRTPLLIATARNHVEIARVLIEAGADVNAQDRQRAIAASLEAAGGR